MIGSGFLITPPRNRIENGGGSVIVNADGSISLTPLAGKNMTLTSGQLLLPGGTAALPDYTVTGSTNTGVAMGTNVMGFTLGGGYRYYMDNTSLRAALDKGVGWSANTDASVAADLLLYRDAANILAQRNGGNAQTFRLYNTFTDAANYERGILAWVANVLELGNEAAGTGIQRRTKVRGNPVELGGTFTIDSNGILALIDNAYDIGASGATRPRSLYLATHLDVPTIAGRSGAAAPTTTDIPASRFMVWKNTTDASVKLYYNDAGTLKSVALV